MNKKISLSIILSFFIFLNVSAQNKMYVDVNATGNNDGTSWTNAFTSLATAVHTANTNLTIDSILIAEGTYYPEKYLTGSLYQIDILKNFLITRDNLTILGGFATGGVAYDPSIYKTITSGNIGNPNDSTDNCKTIWFIVGNTNDSALNITLDGFTVRDAYGITPVPIQNGGVGVNGNYITEYTPVRIHVATVKFKNMVFENNYTEYSGAVSVRYATGTFENCQFLNNISSTGSAGIYSTGKVPYIQNCLFKNNSSAGYQACLLFSSNKGISIVENNTFDGNISSSGLYGVIECNNSDSIRVANNIFINQHNQSILLRIGRVKSGHITNNIIFNNKLVPNPQTQTDQVSIFYIWQSHNVKIENNTIVNNDYYYTIYFYDTNSVQTKNNLIYNNIMLNNYGSSYPNYKNFYTSTNEFIQNDTSNPNNINGYLDPLFIKFDTVFSEANLGLQFCSPLLNTGDNNIVSSFDFLGNTRIRGSKVDIGAIEKQTHDSLLQNATLTQPNDNNSILIPICEENNWTYYTLPNNPDVIVLGILWDTTNTNKQINDKAIISIISDSSVYYHSNDSNMALGLIPRYWNIDLGNDTLSAPVSMRFFFSKDEVDAIINSFNNESLDSISPIQWFTMPVPFDPSVHLSYNNINNGNYQLVNSIIDSVNNINYVELQGLNNISSGGGFMTAGMKSTSVTSIKKKIQFSVVPNPSADFIYINFHENKPENNVLSILDLQGRIKKSISLNTNNKIDIQDLPSGIYFIKVANSVQKFIKN